MSNGKLHILVIDDNAEDRDLYKRLLHQSSEYEFILSEATTGLEGIERYATGQPDGILLDYRLPDYNGLDFLSEMSGRAESMYR